MDNEQFERLTRATGYIETLYAVTLLEYHDMNFLFHGTRPNLLNESKQELFVNVLYELKMIKENEANK